MRVTSSYRYLSVRGIREPSSSPIIDLGTERQLSAHLIYELSFERLVFLVSLQFKLRHFIRGIGKTACASLMIISRNNNINVTFGRTRNVDDQYVGNRNKFKTHEQVFRLNHKPLKISTEGNRSHTQMEQS